jgi:broad specificity phosphatase PhoE
MRHLYRVALVAVLSLVGLPRVCHADESLWAQLRRGAQVVLIRHAITTPGVGDPPEFRLDDCSTQRNLTDDGRAHARRLGEAFRTRQVAVDRLLSSPWCRCIETAKLALGRAPETSPALSNLFGRPENREPQIAELRKIVSEWRGRGNLVLVSHGSTIAALTGVSPDTAEMVVVTPRPAGQFDVLGRLSVK